MASRSLLRSRRPRRDLPIAAEVGRLESLERRTLLSTFTRTSPTIKGLLPTGVTEVGGIVIDLVGVNGARVVSQIPASSLHQGYSGAGVNSLLIGTQAGFTSAVVNALGGGLSDAAVRITLYDGDSALNEFDYNRNSLTLNGHSIGGFSAVATQETSSDGLTVLSNNPAGGFRDNRLDTGFFRSTGATFLNQLYASLNTGKIEVRLNDTTPNDNYLDFKAGVDGGLVSVGQPPNVDPVISGVSNSGPIVEGGSAIITVTASDPDSTAGGLSYQFDLDDDGSYELTNTTGVASRTFADDGSYRVNVRVTDTRGGQATSSTVVRVDNVAPGALITGGVGPHAEGTPIALGSLVSDPGADTFAYAWSVTKDGIPYALPAGTAVDAATFAFTPGDDGQYAVTLVVTDDDGGEVAASATFSVANAAPSAAINGARSVAEGIAITLGSTASDPAGAADLLAYAWSVNRDGAPYALPAGTVLDAPTFTFTPDDDGSYLVTLVVTDGDGGSAVASATVAATNVSPTLAISGNASVDEGSTYTLNLSASDPGADTITAWVINWGDGSPLETLPGNATSATHAYADGPRTFTILATATDEDGTFAAGALGAGARAALDPSFGNNGEVTRNLDGHTGDYIRGLTLTQPDGKILALGVIEGGTRRVGLARYNPADGSLDATFGNGGTVVTEFDQYAYPSSLAIDAAGNILVAGTFGIARYGPTGLLDASFGNGGRLTSFSSVSKLVVDAAGRIVAGDGGRLARFLGDGTTDITFGQNQSGVTSWLGASYIDFAVAPDGSILTIESRYVGGTTQDHDLVVRKYTPAGQPDLVYGDSGEFRFDDGGLTIWGHSVAIHQGKVFVGGTIERRVPHPQYPDSYATETQSVLLIRVADDGRGLDATFGASGRVEYRHNQAIGGTYDFNYGMAVDPAGRVIVNGAYGLYRFSASGQHDASFGAAGYASRSINAYSLGMIAFGTGGEIYLGGYTWGSQRGADFAVQRWTDSGTPDTAFNGGRAGLSYVETSFIGPLSDQNRHVTVQQADGKILVVGHSYGGNYEIVLARYLPDGRPDAAFGAGSGLARTGLFDFPTAAAVAADGGIYVAAGGRVYRFRPDGTLDTGGPANGFGASGSVYAGGISIQALRLDAAGNLYVGGSRYQPARNADGTPDSSRYSQDMVVARFSASGVLDTAYGLNGYASLDLDNGVTDQGDQNLYALAIDDAGRAIVVGSTVMYPRSGGYAAGESAVIARFRADGKGLDPTFHPDGDGVLRTVGLDGSRASRSVALDGQGRILVGFWYELRRYNPDGSPDLTFNQAGSTGLTSNSFESFALDSQGRIVAGGYQSLARFTEDGRPDAGFGPNGRVALPNRYPVAVAVDSGDRIVAAGYAFDGGSTGNDFWIGRYITGGLPVTVNNVRPQGLAIQGPAAEVEGSTIELVASATDPAGEHDPLTYSWTIYRNGTVYLQRTGERIAFQANDDGRYDAQVTVSDGDGGSSSLVHGIVVANSAPTATLRTPTTGLEGNTLTVTLADADDASGADLAAGLAYAFDFGQGYGAFGPASSATFTPADDGPLFVKAKVRDKDGGVTEYSATIAVENARPVAAIAAPASGREGTAIALAGSATDAGVADATAGFGYEWAVTRSRDGGMTWQDYAVGQGANYELTPDDDGIYRAVVVAVDKDGGRSDAVTQEIAVEDVAPSGLVLTRSASEIDEGGTILVTGSFEDPGASDAHTVRIAWGDGSPDTVLALDAGVRTFSAGHRYANNPAAGQGPSYAIEAVLADTVTDVTSVAVRNVAPTPAIAAIGEVRAEGTAIAVRGTATDPGEQDVLSLDWSVYRDGESNPFAVGEGPDWSFTPDDNGRYRLVLTASDGDGGITEVERTIDVVNVAPTVSIPDLPPGLVEGTPVILRGVATDPGAADTLTYAWTVLKGGIAHTDGTGSDVTFTPDDDGAYEVVLIVTDKDGDSSTAAVTVVVANAAPTASIVGAPATGSEGTAVALGGIATDPGAADTLSFAWAVTRGGLAFASGAGASFAFTPDDNGEYVVTLVVTDDDGATSTDTRTVIVTNVAPTAALGGRSSGVRGQTLSFAGSFADQGTADTWTATVNYGDGTGTRPLALGADGTFRFAHAYQASGLYTVTVVVADDDGGTRTVTRQVEVKAWEIQADPFDPTRRALAVGGTTGRDSIHFSPGQAAGTIRAELNGVVLGDFAVDGSIVAYGQAGDDTIHVAGGITRKTLLDGGDGDDHLNGGNGPNLLLGRAGNDMLIGGLGFDILIGGLGADRLNSNGGDDILIGGVTAYDDGGDLSGDAQEAALCAILNDWAGAGTPEQRRLRLSDRLNEDRVFDDGSRDVLQGASGWDWFFANPDLDDDQVLGQAEWITRPRRRKS